MLRGLAQSPEAPRKQLLGAGNVSVHHRYMCLSHRLLPLDCLLSFECPNDVPDGKAWSQGKSELISLL